MGLFSRKSYGQRQAEKCARLTMDMVNAFSEACELMTTECFSGVIAFLVNEYRMANDVTTGQLRYQIETIYSKLEAMEEQPT